MKIKIKDIKPQGLEIDDKIEPESIDHRDEDGLEFVTPLQVVGKVERLDSEILSQLHVSGSYLSTCSRCVEEVQQNWHKHLVLSFEIIDSKDEIDLGEEIRQEVLVSLPPKVLCDEKCKGICPECGANRNQEDCKCHEVTKSQIPKTLNTKP